MARKKKPEIPKVKVVNLNDYLSAEKPTVFIQLNSDDFSIKGVDATIESSSDHMRIKVLWPVITKGSAEIVAGPDKKGNWLAIAVSKTSPHAGKEQEFNWCDETQKVSDLFVPGKISFHFKLLQTGQKGNQEYSYEPGSQYILVRSGGDWGTEITTITVIK
jgi:hypothetical protein